MNMMLDVQKAADVEDLVDCDCGNPPHMHKVAPRTERRHHQISNRLNGSRVHARPVALRSVPNEAPDSVQFDGCDANEDPFYFDPEYLR